MAWNFGGGKSDFPVPNANNKVFRTLCNSFKFYNGYILHYRTLNHPDILALLGVISDVASVTLITNLVNGKNLHSILFVSWWYVEGR